MLDYETWLLDTGDEVIRHKTDIGYASLSAIEKAIYCFWVIDYAVRNSGTLEPMRELHPSSVSELNVFASTHNCTNLLALLSNTDESQFCESYYSLFSEACSELAQYRART